MALATAALTRTWTYVDGDWHEGNVPILGPRSHAMWLGSSVFDGARWFEGVAPDLDRHAARVNASATALGLEPTMAADEIVGLTWDGLKKFDGQTAVYIRPMYWAEHGGYMGVPADPASTRFCLCLYESPMIPPSGFSVTVSPFRRPSLETMPTNAKAGCLYPNNGRAIVEAKGRGFDNALVLDIHPYVQDQMFAEREGIFGKRLVAGAFVFSAGLGLVATNCVNAFSYGYDKLRFIKPVFIGDTIYSIRTNLDKTPRYKDMGLIRASYEVFKGEGELVLYCEHLQTVKYRSPADFVGKTEK